MQEGNALPAIVREVGSQMYKLSFILEADFTQDLLDILLSILVVFVSLFVCCLVWVLFTYCHWTNATCMNKDTGPGFPLFP